jgi:hypothetical protein
VQDSPSARLLYVAFSTKRFIWGGKRFILQKSHLSESLAGRSLTRPSDRNAFSLLLGFVLFSANSASNAFNDFYEMFFFF